MRMIAVKSSNVAEIGYDEGRQELFVRFHSGALYRYDGVPLSVWVDFKAAESLGVFLNKRIKTTYAATLVDGDGQASSSGGIVHTIRTVIDLVRESCRRPALF